MNHNNKTKIFFFDQEKCMFPNVLVKALYVCCMSEHCTVKMFLANFKYYKQFGQSCEF